jgi:broad specificity phosphatase PhoE
LGNRSYFCLSSCEDTRYYHIYNIRVLTMEDITNKVHDPQPAAGMKAAAAAAAGTAERARVLRCMPAGTQLNTRSKTLIFIRHCESTFNQACTGADGSTGHRPVGGPDGSMSKSLFDYEDSSLTEKGSQQATALGQRLRLRGQGQEVELVVCSPLERTLQTATLAFPEPPGSGGRIIAHEGAREMMFPNGETVNRRGKLSDKAARFPTVDWSEVADEEDTMWARCADVTLNKMGRERSAQVAQRMVDFLDWLLRSRPERVIAVVTHGLTLNMTFGENFVSASTAGAGATARRCLCIDACLLSRGRSGGQSLQN